MALLETVGGAAFSVAVEKGLDRAIDEFKQICRVPEEIRGLVTTANLIRAVLRDAEEKQISNVAVAYWLREVKEVFLDAEDLVDEVATDAALQPRGADWRKKVRTLSGSLSYIIRNITGTAAAQQAREIHERIDYLARQKDMLGLRVSTAVNGRLEYTRRLQTSSLSADENTVVGRDGEKEIIIRWLLSANVDVGSSNSRNFSVLPIVGMRGAGKTILARLVFNDQKVRKHFDLMMWVCVSVVFDLERVTGQMIDAPPASRGKAQMIHWDWLQKELHRKVEGRTFLLVLDDVWEADEFKWEKLFEPLKFGGTGSKIVITTRNRNVVDQTRPGRMDPPILLGGLSDDGIWSLFKRYAFDGVTDPDGIIDAKHFHLQGIGKRIVPRLKGSPLAARTVGSLLNTDLDAESWTRVLNSELWRLPQGPDDIFPALGASYQFLSGELKQCFAYCSLFPKDYPINKEDVVQLWNAQSFIRMERGTRTEATGCSYFDELLHRCFFDPARSNENHFVMHDLIHDLAEYVAMDDCFRLEDQRPVQEIRETVRHVSLQVRRFDQEKLEELCRHEKLRTLLFLERCMFDNLSHALDELFSTLKWLRVLRLSGCGITELPNSLGGLKHLRYIDVSGNHRLENLPESLGDLYNLQVFKLIGCNSFGGFPRRTSELINLRHLQADYELVSSIDGLGKLTGLQELEVSGRALKELGPMGMLRRLDILYLKEVRTKEEAVHARLGNKEHLQVLSMEWSDPVDPETHARNADPINRALQEEVLQALHPVGTIRKLAIWRYGGVQPPRWMEDPVTWSSFCLESVDLCGCPNWEALPSLGRLRRLKTLQIRHMHSVRQLWLDPPFFPSLEELHISDLPEWEEWKGAGDRPPWQEPSALRFFPRLCRLNIRDCPKLRELPPIPPTLRHLNLLTVGLTSLPVLWGCHQTGRDGEEASSSHSPPTWAALSEMSVSRCPNLASVSGLLRNNLTELKLVSIWNCEELVSLPDRGFWHLASLKTLYIWNCPKLTFPPLALEDEPPPQPLPRSLEQLQIVECGEATPGWWWHGLQHLTSLAHLTLVGCPNTVASLFLSLGRRRPNHPHMAASLTELKVRDCRFGHRQGSSSSPTLPPLPPTPSEGEGTTVGFGLLTSLTKLELHRSPQLLQKWGRGGLPTSLQCLTINEDDDLDDQCLSACLQGLTSLKELSIKRIENLRSLPVTLSYLSSLETLHIDSCPRVQSLPEAGLPASLRNWYVRRGPLLNQQCRDLGGLGGQTPLTSLRCMYIDGSRIT